MRFTVGSVTGWPITLASLRGARMRPEASSMWYVHDSAYGYAIVRSFPGRGAYGPEHNLTAEQAARAFAAQLNEEYAQ